MSAESVRATVLHRGVPIGVGELKDDGIAVRGDFDALPAYASLRAIVRDEKRTMDNFGFLPPDGGIVGGIDTAGEAAGDAAHARYEQLTRELELRDSGGARIPCKWIELWDSDAGFSLLAFRAVPSGP